MANSHPIEWNGLSKLLHWTLALLVVGNLAVGLGMDLFDRSARADVMWVHKAVGATILILMSARLIWNLLTPSPGRNLQTPPWQYAVAKLVHWLLYIGVIGQTVIGWITSNSGGRPVSFWGLFDLPSIAAKNRELHESMESLHSTVAWVLVALLIFHVGAAIYHQVFMRDNLLARMVPGMKPQA